MTPQTGNSPYLTLQSSHQKAHQGTQRLKSLRRRFDVLGKKTRHPDTPRRVATLLKRQNGKCAYCGMYFQTEDKLEVDHAISKARGGRDSYNNWQLLHAHCHHHKTAKDEELRRLEALMTAANRTRSRMRSTSHVRF